MIRFQFQDFIPKSFICFKEKYSKELFFHDLFAGVSVGIIALPLALAFAIASGVSPEQGLFTAIIAGFLISLLGGSRVQIGGPTGAFVIVVYAIIQKHGYDGLAVATLLASLMLIAMGLARFGAFLKFIPYPVTTGFTTGIAVIIFTSQIKDFFGLQIESLPPGFLDKCRLYFEYFYTCNIWALLIAFGTFSCIILFRKINPKIPGAILAIILATAASYLFNLPIENIANKFGEIPRMLPIPRIPSISFDLIQKVFPDAITIALLGGIESLLSALVADGMTGHKHKSNAELIAQGIANFGSVLFGGIPATGAIARTTANIRLGAKTPLAGMIHAITLLFLMIFLAPFAGKIPLAALSGVLIFVAWNMSELHHFIEIVKGQRGDAIVLLITFLLTVLIDLAVAVQVGVLLSAVIFLKRMTDTTTVEVCKILADENRNETVDAHDSEILFRKDVPKDVVVFEIKGPFFYSVANLLDDTLSRLDTIPKVFLLRIRNTSIIDATGINAIKQFAIKCKSKQILFLISGVNASHKALLTESGIDEIIGNDHLFPNIENALAYARIYLKEKEPPLSQDHSFTIQISTDK